MPHARLKKDKREDTNELFNQLTMWIENKKNKKHDAPTMAIRNAGLNANMKVITLNKLNAKLKGICLEIPHYA